MTPMRNLKAMLALVVALAGSACGIFDSGTGPSDLTTVQIVDLVVGTGAEAVTGKLVRVHYTGWLWDDGKTDNKGKQFDTSVGGDPFEFLLGSGDVIAGFDQGVAGMKVGGKRRLTVPSDLGYGAYGSGTIPANATLVFEIELIAVNDVTGVTSLQIVDLRIGTGTMASTGKKVTINYTGWLYDASAADNKGAQFTQSTEPLTFTLGASQVITGIDNGIGGMKVGGLRRLIIPADQAWGSSGTTGVPPYTTVIFEIELTAVS
jgi:FKBP-type peptidyl-prolyl cis-trans isomerase